MEIGRLKTHVPYMKNLEKLAFFGFLLLVFVATFVTQNNIMTAITNTGGWVIIIVIGLALFGKKELLNDFISSIRSALKPPERYFDSEREKIAYEEERARQLARKDYPVNKGAEKRNDAALFDTRGATFRRPKKF